MKNEAKQFIRIILPIALGFGGAFLHEQLKETDIKKAMDTDDKIVFLAQRLGMNERIIVDLDRRIKIIEKK